MYVYINASEAELSLNIKIMQKNFFTLSSHFKLEYSLKGLSGI